MIASLLLFPLGPLTKTRIGQAIENITGKYTGIGPRERMQSFFYPGRIQVRPGIRFY